MFPSIGVGPKMDGENHGSKPYEQMDDLGGVFNHPLFLEGHPYIPSPPKKNPPDP